MKESTTAAAIKGKNTQVVSKRKEITLASQNNVPLKVEDNFNFIGEHIIFASIAKLSVTLYNM